MEPQDPEVYDAKFMEKKVPYQEQMIRLHKILDTLPKFVPVATSWEKIKRIFK